MTPKEKKEISEEEKEYKSLRKQIQEKLIKFATRIPIFMYLTDYRERSLRDVITQLEPGLFKKVTGLNVKDFELLCSLGVFNASLMNDAIFKFKRYEDSSLSYTGIDKHEGKDVGGWDTVIKREEYDRLFYNQQATMESINSAFEEAIEKDVKPVADVPKPDPKPSATTYVTGQFGTKPPLSKAAEHKNPYSTSTQADEEMKEFVIPEISEGDAVKHKSFGDGIVTKLDKAGKHIRVKFAVGEKLFLFPDAFKQGYLKL